MTNLRQQAELLRKIRRQADQVYGGLIKVWQIKYLFGFFKKYRTLVISSFLLLVLQGLIEIGLMAVSRFQFGWELLGRGRLFWLLLAGRVIIFALVAYFALRLEKTFSVILANDIRRRLLKSHLKKSLQSMGVGSQADLLAKIVYQIPLASMGVSNSFFGAVRWFVYFVIIGLIGLLYTFYDFTSTSHKYMNSQFHTGGYLFWAGWFITCLFFFFARVKPKPDSIHTDHTHIDQNNNI